MPNRRQMPGRSATSPPDARRSRAGGLRPLHSPWLLGGRTASHLSGMAVELALLHAAISTDSDPSVTGVPEDPIAGVRCRAGTPRRRSASRALTERLARGWPVPRKHHPGPDAHSALRATLRPRGDRQPRTSRDETDRPRAHGCRAEQVTGWIVGITAAARNEVFGTPGSRGLRSRFANMAGQMTRRSGWPAMIWGL